MAANTTTDHQDNPYSHTILAFDWQVLIREDGRFRDSASGRTDDCERCRGHVVKVLKELPEGVRAHAEITRINLRNPDQRQLVEVAVRKRNGSIHWSEI